MSEQLKILVRPKTNMSRLMLLNFYFHIITTYMYQYNTATHNSSGWKLLTFYLETEYLRYCFLRTRWIMQMSNEFQTYTFADVVKLFLW